MFNCSRLTDVEYYLSDPERTAAAEAAQERDRAAYYLDDGARQGEAAGTWWRPAAVADATPASGEAARLHLPDNGTAVNPADLRALARGCDPESGERLVAGGKNGKRKAGYDLQFAAPKSVSVVLAAAEASNNADLTESLKTAQIEATRAALDYVHSQGLIVTLRGAQGREKLSVSDCATAIFVHTTSREGDPQLHTHAVLAGISTGPDGKVRALNNSEILKYQGAIDKVYHCEMSKRMQSLGFTVEQSKDAYEIKGVPEKLIDRFSKRRAQVEKAAHDAGFETAENRAAAQIAAYNTRKAKSEVPSKSECIKTWRREMSLDGWTPETVIECARASTGVAESEAQRKTESVARAVADLARGRQPAPDTLTRSELERARALLSEQQPAPDIAAGIVAERQQQAEVNAKRAAVVEAIDELEKTNAVLTKPQLLKEIGHRLIGIGDAEDIARCIDEAILNGDIVLINEGATVPVFGQLNKDGSKKYDAWMLHQSGYDALPPALKEQAAQSYAKWSEEKSEFAEKYDIRSYVAYAQDHRAKDETQAIRDAVLAEAAIPTYATPRTIERERAMLRSAIQRRGEREFVSPDLVEQVIAEMDSQAKARAKAAGLDPALAGMSAEQKAIVRHACNRDGVSIVEGPPGSGKSFSMSAVAEAYRRQNGNDSVFVVAPSWKATDVIRNDTATSAELAKAIQGFTARLSPLHKDHIALSARHTIIVDEAGMSGLPEVAALIEAAHQAGAKVILSGDTRQLTPVSAGSPMVALKRVLGSQEMETIRRQRSEWQRAASSQMHKGEADKALQSYADHGHVVLADDAESAARRLIEDWGRDVLARPDAAPGNARLIMSYSNKDIRMLNALAREKWAEAGKLRGPEYTITAHRRGDGKEEEMKIRAGDRVIFGETFKIGGKGGQQVNNSDQGTILSITGDEDDPTITVLLDKDGGTKVTGKMSQFCGYRPEGAPRLPHMQHAYAISIHAAQGTTVDRAFVLNTMGLKSQACLVAMTRHRDECTMYCDAGRIRDELAARQEGGKLVTQRGKDDVGLSGQEDEEIRRDAKGITDEEVKAHLFAESLVAETKGNVSDSFTDDEVASWATSLLTDAEQREQREAERAEAVPAVEPVSYVAPIPGGERRTREHLESPAWTDAPTLADDAYALPPAEINSLADELRVAFARRQTPEELSTTEQLTMESDHGRRNGRLGEGRPGRSFGLAAGLAASARPGGAQHLADAGHLAGVGRLDAARHLADVGGPAGGPAAEAGDSVRELQSRGLDDDRQGPAVLLPDHNVVDLDDGEALDADRLRRPGAGRGGELTMSDDTEIPVPDWRKGKGGWGALSPAQRAEAQAVFDQRAAVQASLKERGIEAWVSFTQQHHAKIDADAAARRVRVQAKLDAAAAKAARERTGAFRMPDAAEYDRLKRTVDLAEYAQRHGYAVDAAWATGIRLRNASDDLIAVKYPQPGQPHYLWTDARSGRGGSIFEFCKERLHMSDREMAESLRNEAVRPAAARPAVAARPAAAAPGAAPAAGLTDEARAAMIDQIKKNARIWQAMPSITPDNAYLRGRGLTAETISRYSSEIKVERSGNICFAHRHPNGQIFSYERKGPKEHPLDTRSFSRFSPGIKTTTALGHRDGADSIYIGESGVDLMSAAQVDRAAARAAGREEPRELLLSTYGGWGDRTTGAIVAHVRANPHAKVFLCFDNDDSERLHFVVGDRIERMSPAGAAFAEKARQIIKHARPDAEVIDHTPPSEFKDWNDVVRGKPHEHLSYEQRRAAILAIATQKPDDIYNSARVALALDDLRVEQQRAGLFIRQEAGEDVRAEVRALVESRSRLGEVRQIVRAGGDGRDVALSEHRSVIDATIAAARPAPVVEQQQRQAAAVPTVSPVADASSRWPKGQPVALVPLTPAQPFDSMKFEKAVKLQRQRIWDDWRQKAVDGRMGEGPWGDIPYKSDDIKRAKGGERNIGWRGQLRRDYIACVIGGDTANADMISAVAEIEERTNAVIPVGYLLTDTSYDNDNGEARAAAIAAWEEKSGMTWGELLENPRIRLAAQAQAQPVAEPARLALPEAAETHLVTAADNAAALRRAAERQAEQEAERQRQAEAQRTRKGPSFHI